MKQVLLAQEHFDKYWCSKCELPRHRLDPSFPFQLQCQCYENKEIHNTMINREYKDRPLGLNGPAPLQRVVGMTSLVLDTSGSDVIGYLLFHEVDYGIAHMQEHLPEVTAMVEKVASVTGTCFLLHSVKGYHLISINAIPFALFKDLSIHVQRQLPSDYRHSVIRLEKKPDEHCIDRFIAYKYDKTGVWPISKRHREIMELTLQKRIPVFQREIATEAFMVSYMVWG